MERAGLLDKAPFIRVAVPFATGVATEEIFSGFFLLPALIVGIFFLAFHFYTLRRIELRYRYRHLFTVATGTLLFAAGCAVLRTSGTPEPASEELHRYAYAIARVDEVDDTAAKSIGVKSTVTAFVDENHRQTTAALPVVLRLERDSSAALPARNDLLLFRQHLSPIANKKNPEAFDYAAMMRHKGFTYTQYLPAKQWKVVGKTAETDLKSYALHLRDKCLQRIDSSSFSPETRSILNALLLGCTDNLSAEQRAAFSTAGLSHVLAVSGLHTGVIWAVFGLLFAPLAWLRMKRVRAALILLFLWVYAFLTGLSPSTVRACVMATIILAGNLVGRKAMPMNSLFVAFFVMLLYNPHYLFQAAFQLSFLSVFTILLVYPPLYSCLSPKREIFRFLWSCIAVSAAAQLGTLPLVLYYFHELPLLGLLTNLIVVPLLPVLLVLGFLWLALSAAGTAPTLLTRCLDGMTGGMERLTREISALDFASIQNIWIEPHELVFLFVVLFGGIAWLLTRRTRLLIGLLAFVLAFLVFDTAASRPPLRNVWAVYQESGSTTLNFIDNGDNLLLRLDTLSTGNAEREAERFWLKNGIDNVTYLSFNDTLVRGNLRVKAPFIEFQNDCLIVLDDTRWNETTTHERLHVDYAIVCPGFKGKIDAVRQQFDIGQVILAHNLPYFQQTALQEECARLRIPCHRIRTDGAWIVVHAKN